MEVNCFHLKEHLKVCLKSDCKVHPSMVYCNKCFNPQGTKKQKKQWFGHHDTLSLDNFSLEYSSQVKAVMDKQDELYRKYLDRDYWSHFKQEMSLHKIKQINIKKVEKIRQSFKNGIQQMKQKICDELDQIYTEYENRLEIFEDEYDNVINVIEIYFKDVKKRSDKLAYFKYQKNVKHRVERFNKPLLVNELTQMIKQLHSFQSKELSSQQVFSQVQQKQQELNTLSQMYPEYKPEQMDDQTKLISSQIIDSYKKVFTMGKKDKNDNGWQQFSQQYLSRTDSCVLKGRYQKSQTK